VGASVLEERELDPDPDAASERAYRDLLRGLQAERNVHTRIVVDTIAGSSAGGINGIFLAKALAHDLNQDSLRDLWFDHGDLELIVRKPKDFAGWLEDRLTDLPLGGEDEIPRREAREKLFVAALEVHAKPLLDGDEMARQIYAALTGMERGGSASGALESLLPERHPLELAVTVTDFYGYARRLPITDPPVVSERQHRHLLEFHYRSGDVDHFGEPENTALTLAARATSSLPAGFPPVHVGTFPGIVRPGDAAADVERFFRAYPLAGAQPAWAYLIDGGVLDNKPFGPVLDAIRRRPAANEVERYLVYLEPDPDVAVDPVQEPKEPTPIPAVIGALSGLPRSEPILDELRALLDRNEHVRAVRDTIEINWNPVAERVLGLVGGLEDAPAPDAAALKGASERVHDAARASSELVYPTYVRLKVSATVDAIANAVSWSSAYTRSSNQAFLVGKVLRAWAQQQGLLSRDDAASEKQLQFLRDFDLGYAQRRLEFVIAGVSWLYRDLATRPSPTRQQLDQVKGRLAEAVAKLERLGSGRAFTPAVADAVSACVGEQALDEHLEAHGFDAVPFFEGRAPQIDGLVGALRELLYTELEGFTPGLYADLLRLTSTWEGADAPKLRRDLLIRYLGFPIWDALLYPLEAYTDVGERDAVRIARLSPADSTLLKPPQGEAKVLGGQLGHAYSFFSRRGRENDYLWGRLDAAERLVRLLLTRTDADERVTPGSAHPEYRSHCKSVFRAVLEEEADHVPTIADEVAALRTQVDAL
jgi:patatin-related protein